MEKQITSPIDRNFTIDYGTVDIAWWTITIFGFALSLFLISFYLIVFSGQTWVVVLVNSLAIYCVYIVLHDAAHNAVFKSRFLNVLLGNFCIILFHPGFAFRTYKRIHMSHHRFTNDPINDPDFWANSTIPLLRPFKWLTTDIGYILYFLKNISSIKRKDQIYQLIHVLIFIFIVFGCIITGNFWNFCLFWFIPFRVSLFFLTLFLDYLPHAPYEHMQKEAPFDATRVFDKRGIIGKLIFILMLGQNYHLSHHLFPSIPFYKSQKVWDRIQEKMDITKE